MTHCEQSEGERERRRRRKGERVGGEIDEVAGRGKRRRRRKISRDNERKRGALLVLSGKHEERPGDFFFVEGNKDP